MPIYLEHKKGTNPFDNIKKIMGSHAAYVGIPASSNGGRARSLQSIAEKINPSMKTGKLSQKQAKKKSRIFELAAENEVNNAQLLFIHTRGSMVRNIPARPVIEPAIMADGNRQPIAREIAESTKAAAHGDYNGMMRSLKRASLAGQNASRKWFTDSRNAWAPNSPRTIKKKGSDKPLIDTGILRSSIIGVVK